MKNSKLIFLLCTFFCLNCFAQENDFLEIKKDTISKKEKYNIKHTIGIQANRLLNQVGLFEASVNSFENPYLLTYARRSDKNNWEFSLGIGGDFVSFKSTEPEVNTADVEIDTRLGMAKRYLISKRIEILLGIDAIYKYDGFKSTTVSENSATTQTSVVNETENTFGGGLRLGFDVNIYKNILLGSEVLYYFKHTQSKFRTTSEFIGGGVTLVDSYSKSSSSSFNLNVPSVIFLKFRF